MKTVRFSSLLCAAAAVTGLTCPARAQEAPAVVAQPVDFMAMVSPATDEAPMDVFVLPMSTTSAALGEDGHPEHGHGMRGILAELSDDQLDKLHSLKEQFLDAAGPKWVAIGSKERKLKDLLMQSNIDAAQIKQLQGEINSLKADLSNLKADNLIAAANVLTVEQRKEIRYGAYRHSAFMSHHHMWGHSKPHQDGPGPHEHQ